MIPVRTRIGTYATQLSPESDTLDRPSPAAQIRRVELLSKELATWIAEEEAKWFAEITAEINHNTTTKILPSTQPSPNPRWGHGCEGRSVQSKPRCWDHGCNGRQFSTISNFYRHQREHRWNEEAICPQCNTIFAPVYTVLSKRNRLETPRCWEYRCNGRVFRKYGYLYRHQRQMLARYATCPSCSNVFSRGPDAVTQNRGQAPPPHKAKEASSAQCWRTGLERGRACGTGPDDGPWDAMRHDCI